MSGTTSVHPGSAAAWANNACLTELSWEHRIICVKAEKSVLGSQFSVHTDHNHCDQKDDGGGYTGAKTLALVCNLLF